MKKLLSNKYFTFLLGTIALILLWWLISTLYDSNGSIFPNPMRTFKQVFVLLKDSYTLYCLYASFIRMLIGFVISFIFAFIFGVIAGNYRGFYNFMTPIMTFLKTIPTAAVVFLFIVLSGASNAPIFVVILISMPILYEAIASGISSVPKSIIEASKMDGANRLKRNIHISIPLAIPSMVTGLISSFSLSFKIEIMSEVITGYTKNGLGSLMKYAQNIDPTNLETILAYSIIAVLFMFIVTFICQTIKKRLKIPTKQIYQ